MIVWKRMFLSTIRMFSLHVSFRGSNYLIQYGKKTLISTLYQPTGIDLKVISQLTKPSPITTIKLNELDVSTSTFSIVQFFRRVLTQESAVKVSLCLLFYSHFATFFCPGAFALTTWFWWGCLSWGGWTTTFWWAQVLPRKFSPVLVTPEVGRSWAPTPKSKRLPTWNLFRGDLLNFRGISKFRWGFIPLHVADGVFWGMFFCGWRVGIGFVASKMDWKLLFSVLWRLWWDIFLPETWLKKLNPPPESLGW